MVKGIIFDFDGLIIDSEVILYQVLNEIFTSQGSELPLPKWQEQIGTHTDFSPFAYLEEITGTRLDHQKLEKELNNALHSRLLEEKAKPGVESYLNKSKKLGLKLGLASSSNHEWVSKFLKNLNLFHYFDCIKTSDDVDVVKPDPSLYIETTKCLELKPDECLVFEDSANGALAAKKAGTKCVIVPNDITKDLDFCIVDYQLGSMAERKLEEVLKIIEMEN